MLLKIIRLLTLCASTYGYMRFFSRRIAPELSIGFTFAGIGSAMFLAGLLNVLPEAALLICAGGLVCLVRTLAKEGLKLSLTLGGAFFLFMLAVLTARLWGVKMIHYDNLSQWALVVRHMLLKNRFPNFQDSYMRFQSYPLGTSALIYYFAKLSGVRAEFFQMLVHWACVTAMLCGLLALAKNKPAKVLCVVSALLLLCVDNNNKFDHLQVDSTLATVALGAAAFCVTYRRDLKQKGFYVIPWLTYLISVKSSGALLVVYVLFLVFLWGGWKKGVSAAAAAFLLLLLWNRHVSYVFESGMMTQYAVSLDNFRRMLMNKRAGSVKTILTMLAEAVFSLSNPFVAVLALSVTVFILSRALFRDVREIRMLLIYAALCYLIYLVGMAGMYIFSMSEKEALQLASYPRYHSTILIYSTGVVLMAAELLSERLMPLEKGRVWAGAVSAACVLAIVVSGMPQYSQYLRVPEEGVPIRMEYRGTMEALMAEYDIEPEKSYYVLVNRDCSDTAYIFNLVNYLMLAEDVQVRKPTQIFSRQEVERCDYVIALGDDSMIGDYIYETYGTRDRVVRQSKAEP